MTIHFILLGAYTAAAINVIAAIKSYVYYRNKRRDSWAIPVIFTGILVLSTAVTWQGIISLLPFMAGLIGTYALWMASAQRIRWLMLPGSLFWIVHNILVVSPTAVASDMINIGSILLGLWRHRRVSTVKKSP